MEDEQRKQAMITALRALTMGDKSEHDLLVKLQQKGFSEASIQSVFEQLKKEGFLSDEIFARKLSDRILHGKRAGTHKLAFELKRRRIPESIRKTVIAAVNPEEQRLQAIEIGTAKLLSFRDTDSRVLRKKLYDFLIRKGYDFQLAQETSQAVVLKLKKSQEEDEIN